MSDKVSILLADHDDIARAIIKEAILKVLPNARVVEVQDGTDATNRSNKQVFDLVILEIALPKKSGFRIVSHFATLMPAERPRNVLLTGSGLKTQDVQAQAPGVYFLPKPCSQENVENLIKIIFRV